MNRSASVVAALAVALLAGPARATEPAKPVRPYPTPPALRVKGNQLTANGKAVRLAGLNIPSLEWSNTGDEKIRESARVALDVWRSNAIRVPVSQDRWFGRAEGQSDGGKAYRAIVDSLIQDASRRKAWFILDLHWSNGGEWGRKPAQYRMPDMNSLAFWKDAATRYANHPAVLFDLYNEPHDVGWDVWRIGGTVEEESDGKPFRYRTPGMQALLDAVRATGAKNVVVAGGLDWGYDLSGVLEGHALKDPKGNGVVYSAHVYPWKSDWDGRFGRVSEKHPVLIGEVGCEPDPRQEDPASWAPRILAYIEARKLHWTAWCFHPDASPRMLKDWDYTPTDYWGAPAREALAKSARP